MNELLPPLAGIALMLVAGHAYAADACPTEDEVQTAITKYIHKVFWSPALMEVYRVVSVDGFTFGPIKFGEPSPYGECPLRVEYFFIVTHDDGRAEITSKGTDETHTFRTNEFGEWVFSVGPA